MIGKWLMEGVEIGSGIYRLEYSRWVTIPDRWTLYTSRYFTFHDHYFQYSQPLNTSVTLSCWVQVNLTESRFRNFRNKNLSTTSVQKFFTQVITLNLNFGTKFRMTCGYCKTSQKFV